MTEETLMDMIDKAVDYFNDHGFEVDDIFWDIEKSMFDFAIFDGNMKKVSSFFFQYDCEDWLERTADEQLKDEMEYKMLYLEG